MFVVFIYLFVCLLFVCCYFYHWRWMKMKKDNIRQCSQVKVLFLLFLVWKMHTTAAAVVCCYSFDQKEREKKKKSKTRTHSKGCSTQMSMQEPDRTRAWYEYALHIIQSVNNMLNMKWNRTKIWKSIRVHSFCIDIAIIIFYAATNLS